MRKTSGTTRSETYGHGRIELSGEVAAHSAALRDAAGADRTPYLDDAYAEQLPNQLLPKRAPSLLDFSAEHTRRRSSSRQGAQSPSDQQLDAIRSILHVVRESFQQRDVGPEVEALRQLVERYRVDLATFGLGRGALDYWQRAGLDAAAKGFTETGVARKTAPLEAGSLRSGPSTRNVVVRGAPSLSRVSKDEVQIVFRILASQDHIPFEYRDEYCSARAHEMAIIMDRIGLVSGKAFFVGRGSIKSSHSERYVRTAHFEHFHVAPILLVDDGGVPTPYVLDPSAFDRAVPLGEWTSALVSPSTGPFMQLVLTDRYIYRRAELDLGVAPTDYRLVDRFKTGAGLKIGRAHRAWQTLPDKLRSFVQALSRTFD